MFAAAAAPLLLSSELPEVAASEVKLEQHINLLHLKKLEQLFFEADKDGNGSLDLQEFTETLGSVLGSQLTKEKLTLLFRRMDANLDQEVTWAEFSDFMLLESLAVLEEEGKGQDCRLAAPLPSDVPGRATDRLPGDHHAPITSACFTAEAAGLPGRLFTGGADGLLHVWNGATLAPYRTPSRTHTFVRVCDGPVSALCPIKPDCSILGVASERTVSFYESATMELCGARLVDLPAYPTCLEYWRGRGHDSKDHIAMGDDAGWVHMLELPTRINDSDDEDEDGDHVTTMLCDELARMGQLRSASSGWSAEAFPRAACRAALEKFGYNVKQARNWLLSLSKNGVRLSASVTRHVESVGSTPRVLASAAEVMALLTLDEAGMEASVARAGATAKNITLSSGDALEQRARRRQFKKIHDDSINELKYSWESGSPSMFTCSRDNTVKITDLSHEAVKRVLNEDGRWHARGINSFAYASSSKLLATCGIERVVQLWNPYGTHIGQLEGMHNASITKVVISEEKNQLFSLSTDSVIKVWDIRNNRCIQTIDHGSEIARGVTDEDSFGGSEPGAKGSAVGAIFYNEEHSRLVTASSKVHLWPAISLAEKENQVKHSHGVGICSVVHNPHLRQVISADEDSTMCVWDVETGDFSFKIEDAHDGNKIASLVIDRSGSCVLSSGHDGTVKMWNLSNGKYIKQFRSDGSQELTSLMYSDHLKLVIAGGWDRDVTIWSDERIGPNKTRGEKSAPLKVLKGHSDDVHCVTMSPPLKVFSSSTKPMCLLASGSDNGEVIVWNMESAFARFTLTDRDQAAGKFDEQTVERLVFLDSGILVSASGDGWVRFWCPVRGLLLHRFHAGHAKGGAISAMSIDSEAQLMVTGDASGCVRTWDVSCFGRARGTCRDHEPIVRTTRRNGHMRTATDPSPVAPRPHWKAHSATITDARWSRYKDGPKEQLTLITSSADCDLSLWTEHGAHVGVFQVGSHWHIFNPGTYKSQQIAATRPTASDADTPEDAELGDATLRSQARGARRKPAAGADSGMVGHIGAPSVVIPKLDISKAAGRVKFSDDMTDEDLLDALAAPLSARSSFLSVQGMQHSRRQATDGQPPAAKTASPRRSGATSARHVRSSQRIHLPATVKLPDTMRNAYDAQAAATPVVDRGRVSNRDPHSSWSRSGDYLRQIPTSARRNGSGDVDFGLLETPQSIRRSVQDFKRLDPTRNKNYKAEIRRVYAQQRSSGTGITRPR